MITLSSLESAAAVFLATISSVSPTKRRRSEWPMMTHWHSVLSIAGDISPVYAPDISQNAFCAPSLTPDSKSTSATAVSHMNGGKIATSTLSACPRATDITPRTRSSASSTLVGFIFQLAATSGIPGGRAPTSGFFQDRDAGQLFALQVLERGTAAGRDVRVAAAKPDRVDRGDSVAAAHQRVGPRGRDRLAHLPRAVAEVLDLGHTDGP